MFLAPLFAVAGLIAAAGPILIHLLNRRRYRTVHWAAMDFLREAIFRNRRIMHLRDWLLLALRTLCILAFGAAMAQPFLGNSIVGLDRDQPVHAVLLVDNSLSMGYRELDSTVLDQAKAQARQVIEELPRGSRISVLPICGSAAAVSYTPYYTKEDALEALAKIEPVDRAAQARETIDLAIEACDRVPEMAAKRIILLSDNQVSRWPAQALAEHLAKLPGPIQVVELKAGSVENAWISELRLRDGVADRQTPAVLVATVRYDGAAPQDDVQVTLAIDGATFDVQSIELQPGQARQVEFAPCRLESVPGDERLGFATAEASVALRQGGSVREDGLPADDRRFLVMPVVERLPVVFVDQWGTDEDPRRNRYGETFHLRRLMAPVSSVADRERQLVAVRHVRIDQVDRAVLEDARLVVVAGVNSPEPAVPLLREYVEQGGNLVIAAGGLFDPALWTAGAWQDGAGILPVPLGAVAVGRLPDESQGPVEPFQLDYNSLKDNDYFRLEGVADEELQDLYRLPYFFKAIAADVRDEVKQASKFSVLARYTNQLPYMVERRVGRGTVLLVTSGVHSDWNTLSVTNAMLVFDRILRGMLQQTLPERNWSTQRPDSLPVDTAQRNARITLRGPSGREEPLAVHALGADLYGVKIGDVTMRGLYRVTATRAEGPAADSAADKLWETPLAFNGPAEESELVSADEAAMRQGRAPGETIGASEALSGVGLQAAQLHGADLWKWIMACVLGALLVELALLAWTSRTGERTA